MPENQTAQLQSDPHSDQPHFPVPVLLIAILAISVLTLAGIGGRALVLGDFDLVHAAMILFFSANLVICYWELCLIVRRDYIEERAEYWQGHWRMTRRSPPVEFLTGKVPLAKFASPTLWADVWASYSHIDGSYADRTTYGYNADIGNGLTTPIPTLVLFVAYTFGLMPALVAGIIGAMLFWQLVHGTSVYWISFFMAERHARIKRRDLYTYVFALNSAWVLFPLLGIYVSIRLIVDGNYSVLGQ